MEKSRRGTGARQKEDIIGIKLAHSPIPLQMMSGQQDPRTPCVEHPWGTSGHERLEQTGWPSTQEQLVHSSLDQGLADSQRCLSRKDILKIHIVSYKLLVFDNLDYCKKNTWKPLNKRLTSANWKFKICAYTVKPRPEAHMGMIPLKRFWKASAWLHNNRYYNDTIYITDNVIAPSDPVESSGYSSGAPQGGGGDHAHVCLWRMFANGNLLVLQNPNLDGSLQSVRTWRKAWLMLPW